MLKVSGPENFLVYSGKEVDAVYLGRQTEAGSEAEKLVAALQSKVQEAIQSDPTISGLTREIQVAKGKSVYLQTCFVCHQLNGEGIPGQIPPLAKSDYLMADRDRSIRMVLQGGTGEMTVNGKVYNGTMTPLNYLADDDIANVLTYVRNNWDNKAPPIFPDEVAATRKKYPRSVPWTEAELLQIVNEPKPAEPPKP